MTAVHPLLVLLAFSVAALVTYGVVLAALIATSVIDDPPADSDEDPAPQADVDRFAHAGR